ncbi:MAG TPA: hypothetical protein VGL12_16130 [Roseiarcus sp.]
MPAMIAEDAAAGLLGIDAPVRDAVRTHCDRRLSPQRPPADGAHGADRALVNKSRNLAADRRLKPIVHRMQDAPGACGGRGDALCVVDPGDQRFFAQHMDAGTKRAFDERRMAARRRADIDKVEPLAG